MQDLRSWWPKIRKGGVLAGDDCVDFDDTLRNENGDIPMVHTRKADGTPDFFGEYGVFHAICKFSEEHSLGYRLMGTQVVIQK